jgi:ubiquitin-conjugating enzyme E2 J1
MQEASELADPQEDDFVAGPLEVGIFPFTRSCPLIQEQSDIFEWHCTMRGVPGSEYESGEFGSDKVSQI